MATSASGILLPATPGRSKMASSLQTLSSSSAFEDVKKTCSRFTDKFDAWVSRARQARSKRDLDFKNDLQTSQGIYHYIWQQIVSVKS